MTDTTNLSGKVALITGASRGIGRALCLALAKQDVHIIALARTQGALEELDEEIQALGHQATLIPCDLKDDESIDAVGPAIYQRWKKLDLFVGNAAILKALSPTGHITEADWNETIATNLSANWRLLRTLDPILKLSDAAHVCFMTDKTEASAFWGAYSIAKAGLEQLAKNYAEENANGSIKVSVIDPGVIATRLRAQAFPSENANDLKTTAQFADEFVTYLQSHQSSNYNAKSFRS